MKYDFETHSSVTGRLRRSGKSQMFAMMYGGSMVQNLAQSQSASIYKAAWDELEKRMAIDPLEFASGFKRVGRLDNKFKGVPVYKTSTKMIGKIMGADGIHVAETDVWVRSLHDVIGSNATANLHAVAWCRRHKIADIEHAIAWLIMQDKVPVVVRAFES